MARRAFSLVELTIVLVIIGIIAAIAVPRLTTGKGNAELAALRGDLVVLRAALERYRVATATKAPGVAVIVIRRRPQRCTCHVKQPICGLQVRSLRA